MTDLAAEGKHHRGARLLEREPSRRQLRTFALIFTAFFVVVGIYPLFRHAGPRSWALALAAACALLGLVSPMALRRPYTAWMVFGEALGWVTSRVLLSLAYFGLFAPAGILMRWAGKDPMKRRFEPGLETYRVQCQARSARHMEHQF